MQSLVECRVEVLSLKVPREHARDLAAYYDGKGEGERSAATARHRGVDLCLEARGARLVLVPDGQWLQPAVLDLHDDPGGRFFEGVVVRLVAAYGGTLHCHVRWDGGRESEVRIEPGRGEAPLPGEEGDDTALARIEEGQRLFAQYLELKGKGGGGRPGR